MSENKALIGIEHWDAQRAIRTANHIPYDPNPKKKPQYGDNSILNEVEDAHLDQIYESMCSGRKFLSNVPLSFVMRVLLHGWRKDGFVAIGWQS
jgi:hypothetical protein